LIKPIDIDELLKTIDFHLQKKQDFL